jgi:hypothetical protein
MYVLFSINRALLINSIRKERCIQINSIFVLIIRTASRQCFLAYILVRTYLHTARQRTIFNFLWRTLRNSDNRIVYKFLQCTILFLSVNDAPRSSLLLTQD